MLLRLKKWASGYLDAATSASGTSVLAGDSTLASAAGRFGKVPAFSTTNRWQEVDLSGLPDVPGMTQPDELKYLYWCCSTRYQGRGRVIELGPFIGRTTVPMAAGLRSSIGPHERVISIDSHCWNDWSLQYYGEKAFVALSAEQRERLSPRDLAPQEGDSFLPLFQVYTEQFKDNIEAVSCDLRDYTWRGDPVEILFIDAAKCWSALDRIVTQFFPCLVDGALVIHQDFKHFWTYWLHPVTERMVEDGLLVPEEDVVGTRPTSSAGAARVAGMPHDYLEQTFSRDETARLIAQAATRYAAMDGVTIGGALAWYYRCNSQPEETRQAFRDAVCRGGFVDNYGLCDLLDNNADCHRSLREVLAENGRLSDEAGQSILVVNESRNSLAFPSGPPDRPVRFVSPELDVSDSSDLVLQIGSSPSSLGPICCQLEVRETGTGSAVLRHVELTLNPGESRPVVAPLRAHQVVLECEAESLFPDPDPGRVVLLAPMLLREETAPPGIRDISHPGPEDLPGFPLQFGRRRAT